MNEIVRVPYDLAWRAADALAGIVPARQNKVLRALRARADSRFEIRTWAGAHRDPNRRLIWIHAASVGESLQALPVIELLRTRHPELQLAFTFFSPSAEPAARKFPVHLATYLPFDSSAMMRDALDALRPSAIVFSKLDVWPLLVHEARSRGIPTTLISGTMQARSTRKNFMAALLLRDAYAALEKIGAISESDRDNIAALGADPGRITVTGDTRFDQVWARRQRGGPSELLEHLRSARPTLVAGSTWGSDDRRLLPAILACRKSHPRIRVILAPHEPAPESVKGLLRWSEANGFTTSLLDDSKAGVSDAVVVNRVGVLGDLYAVSDIAYVGGGFQGAGVHSVLEPASFGKPVLFGAPHAHSNEAAQLRSTGGAISVRNAGDIEAALSRWLTDSNARRTAGSAAEAVVKRGLGAAEASYQLVASLLGLTASL